MLDLELLKKQPFNLDKNQIEGIKDKLNKMSLKEKVGQLFFLMHNIEITEEQLIETIQKIQPGGIMLRPVTKNLAKEVIEIINSNSKIKPFISANLENGVNGILSEGESFGSAMQISATNDLNLSYEASHYIGLESFKLGLNMTFSPVVDLNVNYLNPITGTRAFGDNTSRVKSFSKQFCKGLEDGGVIPVIKHFPGDGKDDRDHHVLPSVNDMTLEKWNETYGSIYKELIDSGVLCIMAGHILLPCFERSIDKSIEDKDLRPATLSKHLLKDLLRKELKFNGLIITDATLMGGFNSFATRKETLIQCVNAGCDMILFTKDLKEDFSAILEGVLSGAISEERLNEAVLRILGIKEYYNNLKKISNGEIKDYKDLSTEIFDKSITLVKNNENILPILPEKYEKVLFIHLGNETKSKAIFSEELEKSGFKVTVLDNNKLDLELIIGSIEKFKNKYDIVIYGVDYQTKSNQTSNRIEWGMPFAQFMPWFVKEIPVVIISLGNPFHLCDAPRIPTYINAYSNQKANIELVVKKLIGKSEFKGISPIDPFCGRFDTRC
ncbi:MULTISPECIES: glycoside hydrolase family 3 N-terminal domain-containing protein [Clostridium]|uniref:beta-N-acetylhexosaminidase n=1 Tax=Clostridium aquiflavi TaxID=3073603 RepID=A0ABU1EI89_9CLOT|nr:glycoside hydrolase family 3 N-terminal domain-containing protein [Clostridium sp. 5N-1]MDR5588097.1 glycoside hydrolase family 3 N-terminal domain-containing protein [Clostridium sp. 5N-1]NFG62056.1 glycoside hydrolase family 3 protein [Clostridium botulinum]NFQ10143.1 glycoside hydrolase family 3 protein [Clostridium botulinum]